jgi:hypothetical protein
MKNLLFWIMILLTALPWLAYPTPASAQQGVEVGLPDLQTLPPFDLQLISNPAAGKRTLRFSNSVANTGPGPLHLRGELGADRLTVTLVQDVHGPDGSTDTRRLGGFAYHPEHNHWHWEGFSQYEIWSLGPNARLAEVVVASGKVGYCMRDDDRVETSWLARQGKANLVPFTHQAYTSCGWRRQGISPGWVDTYQRHLPGQSMDVSDLPDGIYALRSAVDPGGLLAEVDKRNNAARVYFRLTGSKLEVLEDLRAIRAEINEQLFGALPMHGRFIAQ